mmetsp:Transcript_54316/g.119097  ORF Transcript_54316/g.119097 Transcript_54316/m.119097 type:complete len:677 (-) Transcript_54316:320-2350(-)
MLVQVGNRFVSEQSEIDPLFSQKMKEVLLQNKFFQDCHEEFIRDLIVNIYRKQYLASRYLVEEGAKGDCMFVLHSGLVEVSANGRVVCRLKDGSVFGEMALLDIANKRTATVKTLDKCDVAIIFRSTFFHILEKYPWERRKFQREAKAKLLALGKLINVKEDINLGDQARDLDALRAVPFFSARNFSDDFVSELALNVTSVYYKKGKVIVAEGEPPNPNMGLLILVRGVCEVSVQGKVLDRVEQDCLGEITVLGISPVRMATITTITGCHCHYLPLAIAKQILAKFPTERKVLQEQAVKRYDGVMAMLAGRPDSSRPSTPTAMTDLAEDVRSIFERHWSTIYDGLPEEFILELARYLQNHFVEAGAEIIRQGTKVTGEDYVYFIRRGCVGIWQDDHHIANLRNGEFFGETAALNMPGGVRTCSARTVQNTETMRIKISDFVECMTRGKGVPQFFERSMHARYGNAEKVHEDRRNNTAQRFDFLFFKNANAVVRVGKDPRQAELGQESARAIPPPVQRIQNSRMGTNGSAVLTAGSSIASPHSTFGRDKPDLKDGEKLKVGLVLDFEGPNCKSARSRLPADLFEPIKLQDQTLARLLASKSQYDSIQLGGTGSSRPAGRRFEESLARDGSEFVESKHHLFHAMREARTPGKETKKGPGGLGTDSARGAEEKRPVTAR